MPLNIPGLRGLSVHSGEKRVGIVFVDPLVSVIGPLIPPSGFPVGIVIRVELICPIVIIVLGHEMFLSSGNVPNHLGTGYA